MTMTTEAHEESRVDRKPRRRSLQAAVLLLIIVSLAAYGRATSAHDFDSGGMRSTAGTGATSRGLDGAFTLSGREPRLVWRLGSGVERIRVAIVPNRAMPSFANWPDQFTPSANVGWLEFTSTDRSGVWDLESLPHGDYRVRYEWSTRGAELGTWKFEIEQRLPWWKSK